MTSKHSWVCLFVASYFVVSGFASAATVTWDGGGGDNNWSTAANWSGDAVPGTTDDVVFDATSGKDCTVDAGVTIGSVTISSGYSGTVSGGSFTITVGVGDFDCSSGGFSCDTGVVRFTGSGTQNLQTSARAEFYYLENGKSGGELLFTAEADLLVERITASAGTTTKVNTRFLFVNDLVLQGSAGNVITFHSRTSGNACELALGGNQTISYVDFKDINAKNKHITSGGKVLDAGDNCTDSGGNMYVNFNGVKFWTGAGIDDNWSTAANWSGGSVPTSSQSVIFDVTSGDNCMVDANVTVASLQMADDYTGTVSGGSATITVGLWDYDDAMVKFSAGTSTLKFTGSVDQDCYTGYQATYHNIENAKSSGVLLIDNSLTLAELKAGADTTTEVTSSTLTVSHLDLQGSSGSLATFRSEASGDACDLNVTGTQDIQYVDFKDIDASCGQMIDAGTNCTDSGNNTNVNFNGVRWWDGGGVDNNWSTASNWTKDLAPTSAQAVFFDSRSSKNCTVDSSVSITELTIESGYTGTVSGGSNTVTISEGDFDVSEGGFSGSSTTIKLTGSSVQALKYPASSSYSSFEISSGEATLSESVTLGTLKVDAGSSVKFAAGKTVTAATLDLQGTSGSPIYLTTDTPVTAWNLNYTNTSQAVSCVRVAHCDASSGTQVDGTGNCMDLGNNTNWSFDEEDAIVIPSSSATSPLCVEGWLQGDTGTVTVSTNGVDYYPATIVDGRLWYYDATLSSSSVVTVTVKYDTTQVKSQGVSWSSTDIGTAGTIDIRKDDYLLLTMDGKGTTLEIDADYDGETFSADFTGAPGDVYSCQYSTAQEYTSAARIDGGTIQTMSVHALGADLGTATLGCWSGHVIPRTVSVSPAADLSKVWFGVSNAAYMDASIASSGSGTRLLDVTAYDVSTSKSLVARVGDAGGSIIGYKQASCFNLSFSMAGVVPVLYTAPDGDYFIGGCIRMNPRFEDVTIKLYVFAGGALFEGGSTQLLIDTGDTDFYGQYNYYMSHAADSSVCHSMSVIENE